MLRYAPVICLLIATLFGLPHRAVGGVLIGAPATGGDSVPFAGGLRYQQIYNSNQFTTGSVTISGITFFDTPPVANAVIDDTTYLISLSTSLKSVNGLTTDFADNRGADEQVFFSGMFSDTLAGSEFTINGTPFTYNPTDGNLLLEVVKAADTVEGTPVSFDSSTAAVDSTGVFSRVFSFNASGLAEFTPDNLGLVTRFETTDAVVPEPSSLTLASLAAACLYGFRRLRNRRDLRSAK